MNKAKVKTSGSICLTIAILVTLFLQKESFGQFGGSGDGNTEFLTMEDRIAEWLDTWHDPRSLEEETWAVAGLIGAPAVGQGYTPSDEIMDLLCERGLHYNHWKSRFTALYNFPYFLADDIERLIPIVRDGLSDPHPEVRVEALNALAKLLRDPSISNAEDGGINPGVSEELLDEILDMVISKTLFDENEDVAASSQVFLFSEGISGNRIRLRSLERACEQAVAAGVINRLEEIQLTTPWRVAIYGGTVNDTTKPEPTDDEPPVENPFD